VQLDFPRFIFDDDAGIFEIDEVFALQPPQCRHYLGGTMLIWINDRNKICHGCLLFLILPASKRSTWPLHEKSSVSIPQK
jgi:hypothetical protein